MPPTDFEMRQPVRPRRAWVVFLFSLVIPGLGQMHAGHGRRGLVWWVAVLLAGLGLTLAFRWTWPDFPKVALGLGAVVLIQVLGAVDAVRILRRDQRQRLEQPLPRLYAYPLYVVGVLALSLPIDLYLPLDGSIESFLIGSGSSLPTLVAGDRIFAANAPTHRRHLRRGTIIVYQRGGAAFVHRLIGLPGDVVAFTRDGHLSLNGAPLTAVPDGTVTTEYGASFQRFRETLPNAPDGDDDNNSASYLILRDPGNNRFGDTTFLVPKGQVFVLGDNRDLSADSRVAGPVPIADIIGVASFIFWPGAAQAPRDWSRLGQSLLPD